MQNTKNVVGGRVLLLSLMAASLLLVVPHIVQGTTAGYLKIDGVDGESVRAGTENTNVCDGVTCPDGSCAPTRDDCAVGTTISPDLYANDRDEREGSAAAQNDSVREREAVQRDTAVVDGDDVPDYLDPDDDGDGIPTRLEQTDVQDEPGVRQERVDVEIRNTPPVASEASQDAQVSEQGRPDTNQQSAEARAVADVDSDGDIISDEDVIRPAQDYNSSRSNRIKSEFFDPEDESDDDETRELVTLRVEQLTAAQQNMPEVRCGSVAARGDDSGTLWCWGRGVQAAATGDANEDGSLATSTRVLRYITVRGSEVRSWNNTQRAEFARYRELMADSSEPEAITAQLTSVVMSNDRVEELVADEQEVSIRYRAQLRLFGFIPMEREVVARASSVEAVEIDYPWYSFLATKPDTAQIRELFSSLSLTLGGGAGKVSL